MTPLIPDMGAVEIGKEALIIQTRRHSEDTSKGTSPGSWSCLQIQSAMRLFL